MGSGARINNLKFVGRKKEVKTKRCVVCLKSLRVQNKSDLCSKHFTMEWILNHYYQIKKKVCNDK